MFEEQDSVRGEERLLISNIQHKSGFFVRKERILMDGSPPFNIESAFTEDDLYIGDIQMAEYVYSKGIKPEYKRTDSNICSIGFCENEQKWYGWSHRSLFGFAVGDSVVKGDCAYAATDKNDFLDDMIRFWSGDNHINMRGEFDTNIPEFYSYKENDDPNDPFLVADGDPSYGDKEYGVMVSWEYDSSTPNAAIRGTTGNNFTAFPDEYGRGEWTAKTLEDAKQMAVDFSDGVS